MLKGALLAESLRVDAVLEVPDVTLTRVVRRDVSQSATSRQPSLWTFLEFEAEDHVAEQLADALAESLLVEGGWYAKSAGGASTSWSSRVGSSVVGAGDKARRAEAEAYAHQVGVPARQMDWGD